MSCEACTHPNVLMKLSVMLSHKNAPGNIIFNLLFYHTLIFFYIRFFDMIELDINIVSFKKKVLFAMFRIHA